MDPFWPRVAEIRLRKICRAGSPYHGATVRGLETESAPDADRRRRPPRQVVFRVEERDAGDEEEWWRVPASDDRAGYVAVEKLEDEVSDVRSQEKAARQLLQIESLGFHQFGSSTSILPRIVPIIRFLQ